MEDECGPFSWDCYYQEEVHGVEELKHTLLYTLELETTIACAHEEIARKGDEVLHFKCLLSRTIKERDEAQLKCQGLVLENLILQQKIQEFEANSSSFAKTTPTSYLEDDPVLGVVDSSSGSDENFIGTQGTETAPLPPTQQLQPEIVDNVVVKKGLPENGKFLQAVVEAGPLLQTLLLAGPLPQWQHPPPQLNSIEIPPVTIPSSSTSTPRMLLHQDSCVSAIIGATNNNMKRSLEQSCEGVDHDYTPANNTKNQKVVHQSSLTNI
ncbi:reticulocyte-binding protein 2 a like protein [Tanacetum coccineum]